MQMEALLVKNEAWGYVSGEITRPQANETDQSTISNLNRWINNDRKAKSDIILSISSSELKQVKGCITSREVWLKLEGIYQSRGPARKATLLKQLTLHRMAEGDDIREHIGRFFDAVDKLAEMEVNINQDLQTIMLLYSLPARFENFRCAIESRDELPTPEVLRVKIIEESDARKNDIPAPVQDAMFVKRRFNKTHTDKYQCKSNETNVKEFKFRCHRCKKIGHKAVDCKTKSASFVKNTSDTSLCASVSVNSGTNGDRLKWCIDSGATSHLCRDLHDFTEISKLNRCKINLANNATTEIVAKGTASFTTNIFGEASNITLKDALLVPDLRTNLLSVGKITDKGFKVVFTKNKAEVVDKNGKTILIADRDGDLYYARKHFANVNCSLTDSDPYLRKTAETFELWHRRLGHLNTKDLMEAKRKGTMLGLNFKPDSKELECDICYKGKMTRTPFPKKSEKKTKPLEIIHSDVWGPMRTASHRGSKYMVTFTDDSTRWSIIRFIKSKHEVLDVFKEVVNLMENQLGRKVKCIQTDNGTEYTGNEFSSYLKSRGIRRRLTVPYSPEQNGIAERKNRTLLDTARCLLAQAQLPQTFWAEAMNAANYIQNRCPRRSLNGSTPFESWTGKKPNVKHLRDFGCRVHTLNKDQNKGKFDHRSREGIFVGYTEESKGYRVWLPNQRKVVIVRDVKFVEKSHLPEMSSTNEHPVEFYEQPDVDVVDDMEIDRNSLEKESDVSDNDQQNNVEADNQRDVRIGPGRPKLIRTGNRGRPRKQYNILDMKIDRNSLEEESDVSVNDQQNKVEADDERDVRIGPGRPRLIRNGNRGRPRKQYNILDQHEHAGNAVEQEYALSSEVPMKKAFDAMKNEVRSIIRNGNWKLVKRPHNETFYSRGKHIDMRHHFVREAIQSEQVKLEHVSTENMMADIMTKGLPRAKHLNCIKMMKLGSTVS